VIRLGFLRAALRLAVRHPRTLAAVLLIRLSVRLAHAAGCVLRLADRVDPPPRSTVLPAPPRSRP
jgi:hypothetical protein